MRQIPSALLSRTVSSPYESPEPSSRPTSSRSVVPSPSPNSYSSPSTHASSKVSSRRPTHQTTPSLPQRWPPCSAASPKTNVQRPPFFLYSFYFATTPIPQSQSIGPFLGLILLFGFWSTGLLIAKAACSTGPVGSVGANGPDGFAGLVRCDGSDVRCRYHLRPPSPSEPRTKRCDRSHPRCSQGLSARHTSHPSHRLVRPVQGR